MKEKASMRETMFIEESKVNRGDSLTYDVLIVGGGPAGLAVAIRLKQLCQQKNVDLRVCVLEKGSSIGAHILSGAVFETRSLTELIPNWQEKEAPVTLEVQSDSFFFLTQKYHFPLPIPPTLTNHGNYIISLGNLCRFLAQEAEQLGVEIYTGFAAHQLITDAEKKIIGVLTGAFGIDKQGQKTSQYQEPMALFAKQIILAEGCRGSLSEAVIEQCHLREKARNQSYGLGLKEIWEVDSKYYHPGHVMHTVGWPLSHKMYGGGFVYHAEKNRVTVGFVVGLDYDNPYLSPFEEFQRFKTHPFLLKLFLGGKRIAYGARALAEGGWQSLPHLQFPGGVIVGDSAGTLNVAKIKGSHMAMKSGMLAAEAIFDFCNNNQPINYEEQLKNSWLGAELYAVRNIRPAFHFGLLRGLLYSTFDQYLFRGRAPWTFKHRVDHLSLKEAKFARKINYPKPDNQLTFDRLSSVYLSGVFHAENQSCHLKLKQPERAIDLNLQKYAGPEARYCPAQVYEFVTDEAGMPKLQINAQNCIHCKTCDIKDPSQNIVWMPPEGGGGPNYSEM